MVVQNLTSWLKKKIMPKDAQCSEMYFFVLEFIFVPISVFEKWSILYSTFQVNWSGTWMNFKQFYARGAEAT